MTTYVKTIDGKSWVLCSNNIDEKTMHLIDIKQCKQNGDYDSESVSCEVYEYKDILMTSLHRFPPKSIK